MSLEAAIAELNTNITALIGALTTPDRLAAAAAPTPAKRATIKAAPAAASVAAASPTTEAAPTPQPAAAPTPAPAAAANLAAPTIEQARKLVIELGQKKGRDAVMALLTKFGASKLPEVPPHQYAAVIADATTALAA